MTQNILPSTPIQNNFSEINGGTNCKKYFWVAACYMNTVIIPIILACTQSTGSSQDINACTVTQSQLEQDQHEVPSTPASEDNDCFDTGSTRNNASSAPATFVPTEVTPKGVNTLTNQCTETVLNVSDDMMKSTDILLSMLKQSWMLKMK